MTPVLAFLARRVAATVGVLGVVAVLVFLLLRLVPGDPAAIIAGDSATTEQIEQIREGLGLNRPLGVQFGIWFANVLRGDLGESFVFKKTVAALIAQRLEPTIALALCTIVLRRDGRRAARRSRRVAPRRLAGPRADGLLHAGLLDPGLRAGLPAHLARVAQARMAAGAGLPSSRPAAFIRSSST